MGLDRLLSYDVVLGTVGAELRERRRSVTEMGLPAELDRLVGLEAQPGVLRWPNGTELEATSAWVPYFVEHPESTRLKALAFAVKNPEIGLGILGRTAQAFADVDLSYLPANPVGDPATRFSVRSITNLLPLGIGAVMSLAGGFVGVLLLVLLPIALLVSRRRTRAESDAVADLYSSIGILSAAGSLLLAVAAVIGDGYYELAKHIWLSSYLLTISVCLTALYVARINGLARAQVRGLPPSQSFRIRAEEHRPT
jgi:lysylphosphatidylglycerol synthetase-like protein (DUF2156 family)